MEKKTKHRLLGMVIVVALVVLCLPFMQQQPEVSANVITTKGSVLVASKEVEPIVDLAETTVEPELPVTTPAPINHATTKPSEISAPIQQPDNTEPLEPDYVKPKPLQHEEVVNDNIKPESNAKKNNSPSYTESVSAMQNRKPIIRDNGLFDIKEPVWVVQIGSFSNKAQAAQLIKKVRATRRAVFMQQMNRHTHLVFVGPELNQQSARVLADSLQRDYHVRALVVSYKPLT